MIERLNFYDLYGYLVPGLTLITLLWLPYGVAFGTWPDIALSSALLIALVGYVVGLLVLSIAERTYSTSTLYQFSLGETLYEMKLKPSDVILDDDVPENVIGARMGSEQKTQLESALKERFGVCVRTIPSIAKADRDAGKSGDLESENRKKIEIEKGARTDAYFRCRDWLAQNSKASYAQQFHGLYAMMQGLCAVFALTGWYFLGWYFGCLAVGICEVVGWVIEQKSRVELPDLIGYPVTPAVYFVGVGILVGLLSLYVWCTIKRDFQPEKRNERRSAVKNVAKWSAILVWGTGLVLAIAWARGLIFENSDAITNFVLEVSVSYAPLLMFAVGWAICWVSQLLCQNRVQSFAEYHVQSVYVSFLNSLNKPKAQ